MMKLKYWAFKNFFGGASKSTPNQPALTPSYVIDGVDDFIDFGKPDYCNESFSAGCRFKTTDDLLRLWQNRGTGASMPGFQISANAGSWNNTIINVAGTSRTFPATFSEGDGLEHSVYLVYDKINNVAILYVDGVSIHEKSVAAGDVLPIGSTTSTRNLTFGAAWDNSSTQSQHFAGEARDARIYNRALSQSEITQIHNGELITNGLQILIPSNTTDNGNIATNPYGVNGTIYNHNPATFFKNI